MSRALDGIRRANAGIHELRTKKETEIERLRDELRICQEVRDDWQSQTYALLERVQGLERDHREHIADWLDRGAIVFEHHPDDVKRIEELENTLRLVREAHYAVENTPVPPNDGMINCED